MNPKLQQYIEADKLEKQGKAEKEKVRAYVIKYLKRCKYRGISVQEFNYSEKSRFSFNEEAIYNWIKETKPELLKEVTKEVIDLEKLQQAYLDGKIDTTQMPSLCYTESKQPTITVKGNK